jgi:hypothetical protein
MRESIDTLFTQVFVRRISLGAAPFTWEVHGEAVTPIYVSVDRYRSMDAAYEAGQARLAEFIPARKLRQSNRAEPNAPVPEHDIEMPAASWMAGTI